MFVESQILEKVLSLGKKIIPGLVFKWAQPIYHWGLGVLGAVIYNFPSRYMKVIAITGTKGKSTTVYMISKIFEDQGLPVAAIGSLGFKIKKQAWPNTLKMTLPGRLKLQKFLYRAKKARVKYVVLEATSEGIAQNRLAGINVDCAVFTNLHREHLESHGSFENYMAAKQKLFLKTCGTHVLNIDDPYFEKFANFTAKHKITYGKKWGIVTPLQLPISNLQLQLFGDFNEYNALAALAVTHAYGLDMYKAVVSLNSIKSVPGRMEIIDSVKGFRVVIDYAHTPDSLELAYKTLRNQLLTTHGSTVLSSPSKDHSLPIKLICILGAAGGGRDKWKRPEFGRIASQYCDEIILTNEDPYDEDPLSILEQIESGFSQTQIPKSPTSPEQLWLRRPGKCQKIPDRKEAIKTALALAKGGDVVIITGKGSETSTAVAGGQRIPWSDKEVVMKLLNILD